MPVTGRLCVRLALANNSLWRQGASLITDRTEGQTSQPGYILCLLLLQAWMQKIVSKLLQSFHLECQQSQTIINLTIQNNWKMSVVTMVVIVTHFVYGNWQYATTAFPLKIVCSPVLAQIRQNYHVVSIRYLIVEDSADLSISRITLN